MSALSDVTHRVQQQGAGGGDNTVRVCLCGRAWRCCCGGRPWRCSSWARRAAAPGSSSGRVRSGRHSVWGSATPSTARCRAPCTPAARKQRYSHTLWDSCGALALAGPDQPDPLWPGPSPLGLASLPAGPAPAGPPPGPGGAEGPAPSEGPPLPGRAVGPRPAGPGTPGPRPGPAQHHRGPGSVHPGSGGVLIHATRRPSIHRP